MDKHDINFSDDSKVWVYQSSRPFTGTEIIWLNENLQSFVTQWAAHNNKLRATGKILKDRFILLMVDETHAGASGCSIDSSVHFIKNIEKTLHLELFDRMLVHYQNNDDIHTAHLPELSNLFAEGKIDENTLIYDPLVQTKKEFEENFLQPLKNSWIRQFV